MTSDMSTSPYKTEDLRIMTEIVSKLNGISFRFIPFRLVVHESTSEVTGNQPSEVTGHQQGGIPMGTVKSNAHSVCIVGEWKQIYLGVI